MFGTGQDGFNRTWLRNGVALVQHQSDVASECLYSMATATASVEPALMQPGKSGKEYAEAGLRILLDRKRSSASDLFKVQLYWMFAPSDMAADDWLDNLVIIALNTDQRASRGQSILP